MQLLHTEMQWQNMDSKSTTMHIVWLQLIQLSS